MYTEIKFISVRLIKLQNIIKGSNRIKQYINVQKLSSLQIINQNEYSKLVVIIYIEFVHDSFIQLSVHQYWMWQIPHWEHKFCWGVLLAKFFKWNAVEVPDRKKIIYWDEYGIF